MRLDSTARISERGINLLSQIYHLERINTHKTVIQRINGYALPIFTSHGHPRRFSQVRLNPRPLSLSIYIRTSTRRTTTRATRHGGRNCASSSKPRLKEVRAGARQLFLGVSGIPTFRFQLNVSYMFFEHSGGRLGQVGGAKRPRQMQEVHRRHVPEVRQVVRGARPLLRLPPPSSF